LDHAALGWRFGFFQIGRSVCTSAQSEDVALRTPPG
jgi:hypothetical protein